MTRDEFIRAMDELRNRPMPHLCGSKKRPHLVPPGGKPGQVAHCRSCGETVTMPGAALRVRGRLEGP